MVKVEVRVPLSAFGESALIQLAGIYGPGYSERRKQRIKDNHGIEVADPYWETKAEPEPLR